MGIAWHALGTSTAFWWGSTISPDQANYDYKATYGGSPKTTSRNRPVSAKSFGPNPFGLHNIAGNVYEWVEDCWHPSYDGAPSDGSAWTGECTDRMIRGGSWSTPPVALRSANRAWLKTDTRGRDVGFRVVRQLN